jgi:lycopene beta-cyclase
MTLFDYRTDYLSHDSAWTRDAENKPTFMYTMPLEILPNGTHRVFFEETSLVGRGARRLTFEECKRRAFRRLEYLGMEVLGVEEEEYCYIPMGGELPGT